MNKTHPGSEILSLLNFSKSRVETRFLFHDLQRVLVLVLVHSSVSLALSLLSLKSAKTSLSSSLPNPPKAHLESLLLSPTQQTPTARM